MVMRRLASVLAALVAVGVLTAILPDSTSAVPPPFEPAGVLCLDAFESVPGCDGAYDPGAAADISLTFCLGWNADCTVRDAPVNDSALTALAFLTPAGFKLPKGDEIPIGAIAGRIDSQETIGLLNNACSSQISAGFTMMNGSINISDTITPRPEGETDLMQPLALDTNNNGIPDGADKYPSFLTDYLEGAPPRARLFGISHIKDSWLTLNFVFFEPGATLNLGGSKITFDPALGYPALIITQDPTAPDAPSAITDFCAPLISQNILLGETLDNPCSPTRVEGANCPTGQDGAPQIKERGYPLFPCDTGNVFDEDGDGKINDGCPQKNNISETGDQCDNNTSDDGEDSAVNDGCPVNGDKSEGSRLGGACSGSDEGGCTHRANPADGGVVTFTLLALSQRDADGDGIENSLDVCALTPNGDWDPRANDAVNDTDGDGLPNSCDPHPGAGEGSPGSPTGCRSGFTGGDEDQDCLANRADNCPLVSQLQDPSKPADQTTNKPSMKDSDGDGIGDACDPNVNTVNGDNISHCLKFAIDIGGGAAPTTGQIDAAPGPACAAATVVEPTIVPLPSGVTPRPSSGSGGTGNTGGTGGVGGAPAGGVGSLAPTGTEFPLWAAILVGFGAAGLAGGLALLARRDPRRRHS